MSGWYEPLFLIICYSHQTWVAITVLIRTDYGHVSAYFHPVTLQCKSLWPKPTLLHHISAAVSDQHIFQCTGGGKHWENGKYRKGWGGWGRVGGEGGWRTVYFASGFLLYVVRVSLQPVPWVAHRSIYIGTFQSDKTFYWQIFNAHTTYNRLEKKNKTVSKVQHPMFLTELQFQLGKRKVYYKKLIHTV